MTLSNLIAPPAPPPLSATQPAPALPGGTGPAPAQLQATVGQAFIALYLGATSVVLPVGLESQMVESPTRTVVTQTLGGLCIDSLGAGFPHVTISGTTGWRVLQNNMDGLDTFKALLGLYQDHMAALQTAPNDPNSQILLVNTADRASYRCVAMQPMQITRDKDRALLFVFNWILEIVADLSEGIPRQIPSLAPTTPGGVGSTAGGANPSGQLSPQQSAQTIQNDQAMLSPTQSVAYVAHSGDTLQSVATAMYGTANSTVLRAIQANNPQLVSTTTLTAGQIIVLPIGIS